MKKCSFVLMFLLSALFWGCKSNEEKADELIYQYMQKYLYDIGSYSKIETTVSVAKATKYNDSVCWRKAGILSAFSKDFYDSFEKAKEASEQMKIWGPPSYYSSSRSDQKYYEYKAQLKSYLSQAKNNCQLCKLYVIELDSLINQLDTASVIGWEVSHRFRCKTKGGQSTIGDYRFVMDKEFKKIILKEDVDSDKDKERREAFFTVDCGFWDDMLSVFK